MSSSRSFRSRLIWATTFALLAALVLAAYFGLHTFGKLSTHYMFGHVALFGSLAAAFILGGLWQIRKGLSDLNQLRTRLAEVREGRTPRVGGSYFSEVQPLVDEVNALLDHREKAVGRAQAKAGDLAHGLKTPLALLSREAERANASGQREVAETITQQVEHMQRYVDYHLAQARAAASGATLGARCIVSESVDGLIRTLSKIHGERNLAIVSTVSVDQAVQVQREDVDEMLGNLLNNACQWAKTRITVATEPQAGNLAIVVDDDGPGLDPQKREFVLRRGGRSDESTPGSGLGLAIVGDLAELYGGTLTLGDSPLGGLRVRLVLPRSLNPGA